VTSRLALLLVAMLFWACAADDGDDGGDGDTDDGGSEPETLTCSASVTAGTIEYVVSGDLLELSGGGISETWERVEEGDPTRLVHGTWHVGELTIPGVGVVSLDVLVEPDQMSVLADCDFGSVSASAEAVSAAEISDTTIVVLESDMDVQVVTR
jgi:hypothetical protein